MRSSEKTGDRGVTMVEFALLFGLLLMLAIGAFEYGMVFRDSLTVTTAAREGGRVAASTANYQDADCVILEAAAGALQSLNSGTVDEIHIYKSDESGFVPGANALTMRRYSPRAVGDVLPLIACTGSKWNEEWLGSGWDPADRVNTLGDADWIGVRIKYEHTWFTNFLWWNGTVPLADEAVFRIEPPAP